MTSRRGTHRGLVVAAALLAGGWGWFRSADPDVESGNRHYEAGEYAEALEAYGKAVDTGDEDGIHHNMGAALYKLAEQEKDEAARAELLKRAETELRRGAESDDPVLKSSSYHNLGNLQYSRGEYEDAVQSYKRALRANANNDDARYNLEMTLRKLHKDKPPPQQGQGQGQPQQGQGQGQPQQGQGQGQGQPQQGDPQQGQGQGQDPQQGQQGQDPQQGQGQGQDPKQQDPQQGQGQGQDPKQQDPQQGQGQDPKNPTQGQDPKDPQQGQGQGQGNDGDPNGDGEPKTETERKLDSLEHNSRELRRNKLKNQSGRSPYRRVKPPRDW